MVRDTCRRLALACAAGLALAACQPPPGPPADGFRPEVRAESVELQLAFAGPEELGEKDADRLAAAVRDYLHAPSEPLAIVVRGRPGTDLAAMRTRHLRDRLDALGVPASWVDIEVRPPEAQTADAVVRFQRYRMRVPICGPWAFQSSYNPYNTSPTYFGCALERDLALTIANPGDLVRMREPGTTDTERAGFVLQRWRGGDIGFDRVTEERGFVVGGGG